MNPYESYVNAVHTSMSDREVEAAAMAKAAALLQDCQQAWDTPSRPARLAEAVEFNQKLWSILEAALLLPGHPMPAALRVDILKLARFIDRRLLEVLAYPAPEKLTAVIQITLNLAAGLRHRPPAAAEAVAAETPPPEPVWA